MRFIIFSSHNHPEMIRRAPEAGASAYVTKTTHADKQIAQIRESGAQGSPVARAARARMGRVGRSAQVTQGGPGRQRHRGLLLEQTVAQRVSGQISVGIEVHFLEDAAPVGAYRLDANGEVSGDLRD